MIKLQKSTLLQSEYGNEYAGPKVHMDETDNNETLKIEKLEITNGSIFIKLINVVGRSPFREIYRDSAAPS